MALVVSQGPVRLMPWFVDISRIVILQGETQCGKTNLLRHAIPWHRRWTIWPLSMVCWRGIYMNGWNLRFCWKKLKTERGEKVDVP